MVLTTFHAAPDKSCAFLSNDDTGFEPVTIGSARRSSTTELNVDVSQERACPVAPPVVTDRIQHAPMSFALRATEPCFSRPGFLNPSPIVLEPCSTAQRSNSVPTTFPFRFVWLASDRCERQLTSLGPFGPPQILSDPPPDLPILPGMWPGQPTLRLTRRGW